MKIHVALKINDRWCFFSSLNSYSTGLYLLERKRDTYRLIYNTQNNNYCMAGVGNFASNCTPDPEYPERKNKIKLHIC